MKVEILELKLSSDGFSGERGDRFTVPDTVGTTWVSAGWAKDLSGQLATGERKVIGETIKPANVEIIQEVENNG